MKCNNEIVSTLLPKCDYYSEHFYAFWNDWVVLLLEREDVRFNATTEVKRQTTLAMEMQWMTSCCFVFIVPFPVPFLSIRINRTILLALLFFSWFPFVVKITTAHIARLTSAQQELKEVFVASKFNLWHKHRVERRKGTKRNEKNKKDIKIQMQQMTSKEPSQIGLLIEEKSKNTKKTPIVGQIVCLE